MPDFANPFSGMVPRKMTQEELIRALRLDVAAEEEAIHLYVAQADAAEDPLAADVLRDIAKEEQQHVGELMELLRRMDPDEQPRLAMGRAEVEAKAAGAPAAEPPAGEAPQEPTTTIGSLRAAGEEA
jgi:rubrerythrin